VQRIFCPVAVGTLYFPLPQGWAIKLVRGPLWEGRV